MDSRSMKIYHLQESEVEAIKPLWEQLNTIHHQNSNNWKDHFAQFTFEQRLASIKKAEKYRVFVSSLNDEITGYCIASITHNKGEIESIYVHESHRRSSTGQRLMEASIEWLESQSVKGINVAIAEGNEQVLPFYEKLGFNKSMTVLKRVE